MIQSLLLIVALVAFGLAAPIVGKNGGDVIVLVLVIFLAFAGLASRWAFASVLVPGSTRTVTVRNPLKSYTIPWSEINEFAVVENAMRGPQGQQRRVPAAAGSDRPARQGARRLSPSA